MADLNVTSPAEAFARQTKMERRVEMALSKALRSFLTDTRHLALAEGTAIGAATVGERWSFYTSPEALGATLPPVVAQYVSESVAASPIPGDAYTSVMAVLQRAGEQSWGTVLVGANLSIALDPESGPTELAAPEPPPEQLTAAAPKIKRGPDGRPIYRATAALDNGRMSWWAQAQTEARTAVTGLDGLLSTTAMREQGLPGKMWVTRRDERVRDTHVAADGQIVPTDTPFTVGGYSLMHPGDRSAPVGETINCRCITVGIEKLAKASTTGQRWQPEGKRRKSKPGPTSKRKRLTAAGEIDGDANPD